MLKDHEPQPAFLQKLRSLLHDIATKLPESESLDARRVSGFVAVSTLFVALLASLGGEWVSFAVHTVAVESDCLSQSDRMRSLTYFPRGKSDPSYRIHHVELYPDAFLKEPELELDTKNPNNDLCPDSLISFAQIYGEGIGYNITYQGPDNQLPPVKRSGQFPEGYTYLDINIRGQDITSITIKPIS